MSEGVVFSQNTAARVDSPNWGAIWAGMFSFFAIWFVFGLLGMSIFAGGFYRTGSGVNIGMGVWAVILTILAMYVAGRTTGHLAGVANTRDGAMHGTVMFGLAVVAALAITALAGSSFIAPGTGEVGIRTPYALGVLADLGWFGFFSLFLGWLAAMAGAAAGTHSIRTTVQQVSHAR